MIRALGASSLSFFVCACGASAPAPSSAPLEREPCGQAQELLSLVAHHGQATLSAAKGACNLGCPRGCGIAAELAMTGQLDAPDPDLAGVLGRIGCDAGDGRSCFIEGAYLEPRSERDPQAVLAYQKGCAHHDETACATLLRLRAEGWKVEGPIIAAPVCSARWAGRWLEARHIGPQAFEEIELHVDERADGRLEGTIAHRRWFNSPFPIMPKSGAFVSTVTFELSASGEAHGDEIHFRGEKLLKSSDPQVKLVADDLRGRLVSPNELRLDDTYSIGAVAADMGFLRVACP